MQTVYTAQVPPVWLLKRNQQVLHSAPASADQVSPRRSCRLRYWCQVGHNSSWGTLERGKYCNNKPDPTHTFFTTWGLDIVPLCHLVRLRRKERRSQLASVAFPRFTQNALLRVTLPLSHPESSLRAGPLGSGSLTQKMADCAASPLVFCLWAYTLLTFLHTMASV